MMVIECFCRSWNSIPSYYCWMGSSAENNGVLISLFETVRLRCWLLSPSRSLSWLPVASSAG